MSLDLVVTEASEVVVGPAGDGWHLDRQEDAAVAVEDGRVAAVGPTEAVVREYPPENATDHVDASGRAVLPGFVDAHTHAAFAGDRSDEFAARLRGRSYQEILAEGGGILRTVRAVREAGDDALDARLRRHLDTMLAHGSTTVEVKSGYGLDRETELRLLDSIDRVGSDHPVDVVPTFMGAHAVPEGVDADAYVDRVIDEQLPAVESQGIARFCDVFCEEGVFTPEQSRRVLEAGREHGLEPKIHAEEFARTGGAAVAAEVGATSADHLLYATAGDAEALADADVVPVVLPAAAFSLGEPYAEFGTLRDAGAPVALATDFNPNCHVESVGFAMALACVEMGLTPAEALVAATRNAALALGLAEGTGTLETGAVADLLVLDAPSHVHVPYGFGVNRVETVVRAGEVVHERGTDRSATAATGRDDRDQPGDDGGGST